MPAAERFGDRLRNLRFGLDDFGAHALRLGLLLLLGGQRGVLPFGGFRLRDAAVGFGLRRLQFGADVLADVDVGDVDRDDLERRSGIEPFASTALEMRSGYSSTSLWSMAAPTAETTPSPTRATIVGSPAPPT